MTKAMQIVHLHKMNIPPHMIKSQVGMPGYVMWDTLYKIAKDKR